MSSSSSTNPRGMPTRRLGKTEHQAPLVGFSGISAAKMGVRETVTALEEALELGVDYIDVAPSYGDAQVKIGEVLRTRRADYFLACKTLKRSETEAKAELDESLRLLQTDRIDLYQLHAVDTIDDLHAILAKDGALKLFLEARKAGVIRFIGITGHRPATQTAALKEFDFDTCMTPVNFIDRFITGAESGLLPLAESMDVGAIAIKATMRSAIEDKQSAFRYTLSQKVTMTIPAGNLDEVITAAHIARSFVPMERQEMESFLRDNPILGATYCRQCGYCLPCPCGLDIPWLFRIEGFSKRYNKDIALKQYQCLSVKPSECNACGRCERRCPYGIPIKSRMKAMGEMFAEKSG